MRVDRDVLSWRDAWLVTRVRAGARLRTLRRAIYGRPTPLTRALLAAARPRRGSVEEVLFAVADLHPSWRLLQIGANDGLTNDPVRRVIRRYLMPAVLVEPQADVLDRQLDPICRGWSNIRTVRAAVGEENAELTLHKIAFSSSRWATGIASFDAATLQGAIDSGRVRWLAALNGEAVPEGDEPWLSTEQVPVMSGDALFAATGWDRCEVIVIDVEGFDQVVLSLLPLEVMRPEVVVLEVAHLDDEMVAGLVQRLATIDLVPWSRDQDLVVVASSLVGPLQQVLGTGPAMGGSSTPLGAHPLVG
jgi:FkbM family methyltransferase